MRIKDYLRRYGINVDAELIINLIMLFIPGIRFIGAIMLYNRIQRKYGFMGMKKFALFMLMLLIATGTMAEILTSVIWPMTVVALLACGTFLLVRKENDRQRDVLACLINRDSCSLDELCSALKLKEKQVIRAIESLKRQGKLPISTYIDRARREVIINSQARKTSDAYSRREAPGRARPQPAPEPEASPIPEKTKYEKILYQIRYINEQIADKAMSEKIYHIENTTANIFHLVEQKPERANEIQTFMEYYLPTTMNLLYKYSLLEKQGEINSENIASAKRNIEGIMDKVVEGFDTQLDKLFKSDAIDITNDVKVLEKMMKMDRLNK